MKANVLKTWLLGVLVSAGLGIAQFAKADQLFPGNDITKSEFDIVWSSPETHFNAKTLEKLRGHKVLFVPGFFGNQFMNLGKLFGGRFRVGEYFTEHVAFFRSYGIDAELVKINSEAHPEYNSPLIEAAVLSSHKPVILVTHSKGSVDTLQAFFENPDLSHYVAGWIPIQSPFYGTPVADFFNDNRFLNPLAIYILEMLGGTSQVIGSLTQSYRSQWLLDHRNEIADIGKKTKIVNFTSWKAREWNPFDTPLALSRNAMERAGIQNDGLVPWRSGLLPGFPYISTTRTDHLVPVMYSHASWTYDRIRLTKTLMVLLTNRFPAPTY